MTNKRYPGYRKWVVKRSTRIKSLTLGYFLTIVLLSGVAFLIPIIIGDIIDSALSIQNKEELISLLLLLFIITLLKYAFHTISNFVSVYWGWRNEQNIRNEFFDKIQSKPVEYHANTTTGDLMALATNDINAISDMYLEITNIISFVLNIIFILVFLTTALNHLLIAFFFPFVPIIVYTFRKYQKNISPYADEKMQKYSKMTTTIQDSISGAEVVRAFNAEWEERTRFKDAVRELRDNLVGQYRVQAKFYPLLVYWIAVGTDFLVGCWLVSQNLISVGSLVAFTWLLIQQGSFLKYLYWTIYSLESGLAASSRVYGAIHSYEDEKEMPTVLESSNIQGRIEFCNVTFYHGTKVLLKNVSFSIEPNQRIALVGPTGCGKTTIAKLLLRFYEPQEGSIRIDGIDIQEFKIETLRRNIGYIEQDIYLFPRSVKDNIAFGMPKATMQDIHRVAELAQVAEFVHELPDEYNTTIGDRGTRLSGGQKQRIAIARTLLTNPPILIMDDSVSLFFNSTKKRLDELAYQAMETGVIITSEEDQYPNYRTKVSIPLPTN